ncbi:MULTISPECIES: MmcQ/YjbR family DNA-binding protein [Tsukamurella]|uniref:MmcQ/YjbR family DNA-binding protein n=2 Tax=Tsukamurella TaxID=2060 RepID=A0A5C5S2V0_9ACTN|nr:MULTISPECIES: MmcQ/YjbR family DNA-binding protein [Tsukamurella]NMD54723.1 MmcQ/YjbR family DNA-binding protein [Tsukamurella columbiensis]TWS28631.1 MmcQ/YjbR family DNA-binding protein [Tsukamurella conjunctivitidis]
MPHPIMFSDDDPVLARVREIALAFPEATEKIAHGRPTFRCGKMFATYGGGTKKTETRPHEQRNTSVLFIVDPAERTALEQDERFYLPAYMASAGWLGLDLTIGTVDWDEVTELLDASYRQIAPKRAIAALDAGPRD